MSIVDHASELGDTLRKRMPFRHVGDDAIGEDENHIMDEEGILITEQIENS
jgi:hypothetical protein